MMKRMICFLCALFICLGVVPLECAAAAVDVDHPCSLTLYYTRQEQGFSDLKIDIYRVAELRADGEYELLEPYSGYPIRIHGITSQKEWQETAQTIRNYAAANQLQPYRSENTDDKGIAAFTELETGLYMVKGTTAKNGDVSVVFQDFMIYLPTPVEGGFDYDMEAKPKYTEYLPPKQYTVVKLWKDTGVLSERPKSVSVDILKNEEVYKSVTLNRENNWSYSWDVQDEHSVWNVIERDVPEGYSVSVTNNGTVFVITNSKSEDDKDDPYRPERPDNPDKPDKPDKTDVPQTGDTFPLLRYVILMCISGMGMMIFGAMGIRNRRNEEKQ